MPFSHTLFGGGGVGGLGCPFILSKLVVTWGVLAGPIEPFPCSVRGPRMKNIAIAVIFFFSYR